MRFYFKSKYLMALMPSFSAVISSQEASTCILLPSSCRRSSNIFKARFLASSKSSISLTDLPSRVLIFSTFFSTFPSAPSASDSYSTIPKGMWSSLVFLGSQQPATSPPRNTNLKWNSCPMSVTQITLSALRSLTLYRNAAMSVVS